MLSEIITSYEREVAIHFTILSHHGVVLLKLDDLSACLSLYKLKGLYFFILLSFSHLSWDSCTKAYGLSIQIEDVIGQKLHWCNWVKLSVIQLKSKQTFSFRLHTNVVVAGELNHQHWLEGNVIFQNHRRSLATSGRLVHRFLPPSVGQRGRPRVAGGERNTTPRRSAQGRGVESTKREWKKKSLTEKAELVAWLGYFCSFPKSYCRVCIKDEEDVVADEATMRHRCNLDRHLDSLHSAAPVQTQTSPSLRHSYPTEWTSPRTTFHCRRPSLTSLYPGVKLF